MPLEEEAVEVDIMSKTVEPVELVALADTLNQLLVEQVILIVLEQQETVDLVAVHLVCPVEMLDHLFHSLNLEQ
jgi:hypothetical protein